jgi:hypothetical protein
MACSLAQSAEIKFLLGDEINLESLLFPNTIHHDQYAATELADVMPAINAPLAEINEESLLIHKYFNIIKTRQDLLNGYVVINC